jgi:hypothetical protein
MATSVPVVRTGKPDADKAHEVIKQAVEWLTGAHKNAPQLAQLPPTASTSDLITAMNKIIARLNTP